MAKVIDNNKTWFQEVAPRSFYSEDDLENAIIQNLKIIFPSFIPFLFKKKLKDTINGKNNIPDLAMVKDDYSEWYIIEVELGSHEIEHVYEQIETFRNCSYKDVHADYMFRKKRTVFEQGKMRSMVRAKSPNLMVIVNEPKPEWEPKLKPLNCKICIFQIYQDFNGNPLYRLNGEHPFIYTNFCHCKYQKGTSYAIHIIEKSFLDSYGINNGDNISIEYKGKVVQWQRLDDSNKVFLICSLDRPPLDPLSDKYRLNYSEPLKAFNFTKD